LCWIKKAAAGAHHHRCMDSCSLPPFDPWASAVAALDAAATRHAGAAVLADRQARRLARLLAAAAEGSRLFHRSLRGRNPCHVPLAELPIMRKAQLMQQFDDWVTDPALRLADLRRFVADPSRIADPFLGRYTVWESSGSSGGTPGIFVQDAAALAVYDALEAARRPVRPPLERLLDPWELFERVAFVGATSGHFASTVSIERLRRLNPALSGRLHSVSFLQPVAQMTAQLNALAPSHLATYPSAAMLLAGEQQAGRLRLQLQEVWTGGETLSPAVRRAVAQAFGCPVRDSYGASEFLPLAFECRCGNLHLNSDWVILEPVDAQGRVLAPGRQGVTTLLTNLANHVQPLIRYDLGDRVTLHAGSCPCGGSLPVIEVQGRDDDSLNLAAPDGRTVCILPLAVSTVLEEEAGLCDFQVVQQGVGDLLLCIGLRGPQARSALRRGRAALKAFLERQGAGHVRIHGCSGQPGRRGRSGKVQRVVALHDDRP
jgi:phenylacetate-coenzyme A ligase PaaK-like adenylate-forming protein